MKKSPKYILQQTSGKIQTWLGNVLFEHFPLLRNLPKELLNISAKDCKASIKIKCFSFQSFDLITWHWIYKLAKPHCLNHICNLLEDIYCNDVVSVQGDQKDTLKSLPLESQWWSTSFPPLNFLLFWDNVLKLPPWQIISKVEACFLTVFYPACVSQKASW